MTSMTRLLGHLSTVGSTMSYNTEEIILDHNNAEELNTEVNTGKMNGIYAANYSYL